jgi:peptidoglycan/xylan/chitin deacetylase (PgdA/CDA1 family)
MYDFELSGTFTSGQITAIVKTVGTAGTNTNTYPNVCPASQISRIFITFDDSFVSQYTSALPIMQTYGMVGTFYLVYNYTGATGHMTQAETNTLVSDGNELGSHTYDVLNHPSTYLTSMSASQLYTETVYAKQQFLATYGWNTPTFVYPGSVGYNNNTIISYLNQAGYSYDRDGQYATWNRATGNNTDVTCYAVDYDDVPGLTLGMVRNWASQAADNTEVIFLWHIIETPTYAGDYAVTINDFT